MAGGPYLQVYTAQPYVNVRPSVHGKVVCSTRLVASHGGLYLQVFTVSPDTKVNNGVWWWGPLSSAD